MTTLNDSPSPPTERFSSDQSSDLTTCLQDADALKAQGNEYFRSGKWDEALAAYRSGLGRLPTRHTESKPAPDVTPDANHETEDSDNDHDKDVEYKTTETSGSSGENTDTRCTKARAVLNANIGACYVKLGGHKQAVDACSEALADDPEYVKALQRRAASNEIINSWSSLTMAQEDYTTLLKVLPPSPLVREIERSLHLLKPRLEGAQKAETAEMLDKLKGLGNSILGNFGLSTDNFKFEPNGQGGYSMNFSP